jgi:hypothetical protein
MVPTVALPPTTPSTSQVAAVSEVFVTAAAKAVVPPPAFTVAVAGDIATVTRFRAARQEVVPAVAGAVLAAWVALTVTSALSVRPTSSVTVSSTWKEPEEGATTVAVEVLEMTPWVERFVHAYEAML